MADASIVAAFLLWAIAPGWLLIRALRLPWIGVEALAAAGGLSIALVSCLAYVTSAVGLPLAPLPTGLAVVAACLVARAATRQQLLVLAAERTVAPAWCKPPASAWMPWLVLLLPFVVIRQLEPMWTAGLLVPPTLHDGLDHAMWFRLILDTQSVLPSVVAAPPLDPDGTPGFYPWGMHAWLALVAGTSGAQPMSAFFAGLVGISALLPLSIYVFAAAFTGRGWPAIGAAALSLVFWWLPYQAWGWGGHALVAGAVAALPASRLAIEAVRPMSVARLAFAAALGLGLLLVHPSQAMSALLISATVAAAWAASGAGRWREALPFVAALAAAGAALTLGAAAWTPLESFLERARVIGAGLAGNAAYAWPGAVYSNAVWQLPASGRAVLGALYIAGALVALRHPALRPILAVHAVFSLMIPLAGSRSWLTSFWYHAPERLWYLQYACLPILGALGIGGVLDVLARLVRGRARIAARSWIAWPVILLAFLGSVRAGYTERATNFLRFFAHRTQPPLPTDTRLLADFAWIEANVPPGATIFNASADWGLSVPFTGRRTVFWSGGYAIDPGTNWHEQQASLNRGDPYTALAALELPPIGIEFIYAAVVDPRLAVNGREPLSIETLASSVALERVYQSQTGAVFRVRDAGGQALGLTDSGSIDFVEGFWGAETGRGREWRWTNGRGVFRILPAAGPAPGCTVRFLGPDPADYAVRANGTRLDLTPSGHRLPPALDGSQPVTIEILSSASNPADQDPSADDRLLGVRVFQITLDCS